MCRLYISVPHRIGRPFKFLSSVHELTSLFWSVRRGVENSGLNKPTRLWDGSCIELWSGNMAIVRLFSILLVLGFAQALYKAGQWQNLILINQRYVIFEGCLGRWKFEKQKLSRNQWTVLHCMWIPACVTTREDDTIVS